MSKQVYVLHENEEWVLPLRKAFDELSIPYSEVHLDKGWFDLASAPPEGVFYNRMSASSHTRGHRYAPELTGAYLSWLESWGRRVVNNSRAIQLEVSKVLQYQCLKAEGIPTPRTLAAVGQEPLLEAGRQMQGSFITKHNRAGKGLGVRLFHAFPEFEAYVTGEEFDPSIDGITLVQQYIKAPQPFITRMEFIGGRFYYAVRVDTSDGFELCPADACQIGDRNCPIDGSAKFQILQDFESDLIPAYERLLAKNGIEVAGIEFIVDEEGNPYAYDINTNTNYNPEAEAKTEFAGMKQIARFLGSQLQEV